MAGLPNPEVIASSFEVENGLVKSDGPVRFLD